MIDDVTVNESYTDEEALALSLAMSEDRPAAPGRLGRLCATTGGGSLRLHAKATSPASGVPKMLNERTIRRFTEISVGETGEISVGSSAAPRYRTLLAFHVYLQMAIARRDGMLEPTYAAALIKLFRERMFGSSGALDLLLNRVRDGTTTLPRRELLTFLRGEDLEHGELSTVAEEVFPPCQDSCRLPVNVPFGGWEDSKWLDTERDSSDER